MDDEEQDQNEEITEEGEPEEPHLTIFQCFGLIVLLIILQLLTSLLLTKSKSPASDESGWQNLAITHAISGFLTAKAGAVLAGFSLSPLFLPLRIRARDLFFVILAVSGMTILSSELSNILQSIEPIPDSYLQLFNHLFEQNITGVVLAIGIIAPITEELIFRGVMLEGLKKHYPAVTAFFASTALFATVHIIPWLIINAFLVGCFLGWLKLRTQSLGLCVIAHSLYNSIPFLLTGKLSVQIPGFTSATPIVQFQPWWFDLTGVALIAAGIAGIYYFTRDIATPLMEPAADRSE